TPGGPPRPSGDDGVRDRPAPFDLDLRVGAPALSLTMPSVVDKRADDGHERRYLGTVPDTLLETLGIVIVAADESLVKATMPVTPRHHQPHGILHGGASVALAETVASVGA